ncbi:MAG TPA: hypothetical protein VJ250_07315 [Nitrososphaeraceae archaeon]|nr:hypothetical protein [Nitrososphaeraceae archaeon]
MKSGLAQGMGKSAHPQIQLFKPYPGQFAGGRAFHFKIVQQ